MPKVSVIMPVYNSERTLIDSLSSLVNQTLTDIELILVNDYSTDNSLKNNLLTARHKFSDKVLLINLKRKPLVQVVPETLVYHMLPAIILVLWIVMILQFLICLRKCMLKQYQAIMILLIVDIITKQKIQPLYTLLMN